MSLITSQIPAPAQVVTLESLYALRAAGTYVSGVTGHASRLVSVVPSHPEVPKRQLPVVMLHGVAHNRSWAYRMQYEFTQSGFRATAINYATFGRTFEQCAADVLTQIREFSRSHGDSRVHVVAHSLGGLLLRKAMNDSDEIREIVASVVTIATPHTGTPVAMGWTATIPVLGSLFGAMSQDSRELVELDAGANPGTAPWTCVWSATDEFVPGKSGMLVNPIYQASNIDLSGLGHYGLTYDFSALDLVRTRLISADTHMK